MSRFCCVILPTGKARVSAHHTLDFDSVHSNLLVPAISRAGYLEVRVDPARLGISGGELLREQIRMCHYVVADLTIADPDVTYELGRRGGGHVRTSQTVGALGTASIGGTLLAYAVGPDGTAEDDEFVATLAARLTAARERPAEWSVHDFLDDWPGLPHSKTDTFRDAVSYDPTLKEGIRAARESTDPIAGLRAFEASLGVLEGVEAGVLIDLLLSYRSVSGWEAMAGYVERLPPLLASQALIREQYGLALNRQGRTEDALAVLEQLITDQGARAENCSILGRIHKDLYLTALTAGDVEHAERHRSDAINAYLRGFESDWRDAYPGINAVQLIARGDREDSRLPSLIAVVEYSLRRKIDRGGADYWDHATLLELATLADDESAAGSALDDALASPHEGWMTDTTSDTLDAIVAMGAPDWVREAAIGLRQAG